MKYKVFTLFFLLFFNQANAQDEANIWYFGYNAGIDFNSGAPVALTDGQLSTYEGCVTISNAAGELLFYTDGIKVWDKNHTIMPNGFDLLGNSSSTQSGIIVPNPANPNIYYVFTVDELCYPNGLRFSEVDLSLNGGTGDVTSNKNIPLHTPSTEKITAIKHANGIDFWVITHDWNSNDFLSFKVTAAGVNLVPVVSSVGNQHNGSTNHAIGYLKASVMGQISWWVIFLT